MNKLMALNEREIDAVAGGGFFTFIENNPGLTVAIVTAGCLAGIFLGGIATAIPLMGGLKAISKALFNAYIDQQSRVVRYYKPLSGSIIPHLSDQID